MKRRTDVPDSAFPRRGAVPIRRLDARESAFPQRSGKPRRRSDVPPDYLVGSTGCAVATEWLGRLAAAVAVALFVLVLGAINKGLLVQDSAKEIVRNFHVTNDFFATRADLTAPATARKQLQDLQALLTRLNDATATDVRLLAATLPDVARLLAAGEGDVRIAHQLDSIASVLKGAAGQLHGIAGEANATVSSVDELMAEAVVQVRLLNNELERTTRKLAPLPAAGGN